jgi:hypothetical protein
MWFFQNIQVINLPENLSQNIAEEENEKKSKDLQKKFMLCRLIRRSLGFKTNFLLIKVEIHTKNLRAMTLRK